MEVFLLRFWLKALYSLFWTFLEEFSTIMFILWTKLKTSSVNHEDVLHTFYMSSFKTLIAKLLENSIILVLDLQLRSISKQTSAKQMVSVMIIILFICGTYFEKVMVVNLFEFNPFTSRVHKKVIHTYANLHLKAAGLFKYVWPFSGHLALKGQ